jgi:hypothetical protein
LDYREAENCSFSRYQDIVHATHRAALIVVVTVCLPFQYVYWYRAKREKCAETKSDIDILRRESIARYNPGTMTPDEPEVAAKPFPRRWIWIMALYAVAIVALGCVGVLYYAMP